MLRRPKLESTVERNRAAPYTFEIPSKEERESVQPGNYAKIIVLPKNNPGERIWVKVISKLSNGRYLGSFANDPIFFKAKYEDEVIFREYNIAAIDIPEKNTAHIVS